MSQSLADQNRSAQISLVLAVSGFASTFAGRITEPLVGVIARDFATDPHTIALLSTAYALPYAFIQPILGPVGDAIGKEWIIKLCLALLALTLLACAVAPTTEMLFIGRVVSGAAAGGVIPLALAMIGDRVPMERRQVAISRFLVAVILGQLSGSSGAGILARWLDWRGVFGLAAGIAIAAFAASFITLRDAPTGGRFVFREAILRYRVLLANPRARALFSFVFVEAIAIFGIFPYVAPTLEANQQGGAFEAGLVIAGFGLGGLVYSSLVSFMLRTLRLRGMLRAGGVVAGTALIVLGLGGPWPLAMVAMLFLGLGYYMLHNSFQTQVTELTPTARASAVALHAFSFFVGQALGVAVMGFGLSTIGLLPSLTVSAAVILGIGLVSAAILAPRAVLNRA